MLDAVLSQSEAQARYMWRIREGVARLDAFIRRNSKRAAHAK